METKSVVSKSEQLRQGLIKRVSLMVFGCIASTIVAAILPLLYLVTTTAEVSTERVRPAQDIMPLGAFVPPVVMLIVLGLLIYGVYDLVLTFMRYRKSQKEEQQLFP